MSTGHRPHLLLLYPPDARALLQALAKQLQAADLLVDLRPLPEPGDLPAALSAASGQGTLVLLAVSAPSQETLAAALSSAMAAVLSGRWLVLQLDGTERLALPEAVEVLAWPRQAKGAAATRTRQATLERIRELAGATPSTAQPAAADQAPVPGAMEARKKPGKANKKKDSNRDNFSREIRLALSRRVGGYCSKPGCKNHTSGPHSESSKVTDTGVAAHITAAAPGGPRYNSKLEPEQRSSADNGIWLCQNHAKLIDSDAATYTEALLREWKAQAESEQQDRQNGIHPSLSDWNWPQPLDFTHYRSQKRQGFVGRKWLFEKVRTWAANPKGKQALLIVADDGMGKSAFLAELLDTGAAGLPVLAQHFCRSEVNLYLAPGRFVQSLAAQLKEELPAYRKLLEADDASQLRNSLDQAEAEPLLAFEQALVATLAKIPAPATQCLLVVDALDEALRYRPGAGGSTHFTIVELLARQARNLPAWLRLLATSRLLADELDPLLQGCFAIDKINAEEARNLTDIHDYVEARCAQEPIAAYLIRADVKPRNLASKIQSKSGGSFGRCIKILGKIIDSPEELGAFACINAGGEDADTYRHFELPLGNESESLNMIRIKQGEHRLGKEKKCTLPSPVYIAEVPVTRRVWSIARRLAYKNTEHGRADDDLSASGDLPKVFVKWSEAEEFCNKLNEVLNPQDGYFRLPYEAEWEVACLAGSSTEQIVSRNNDNFRPTSSKASHIDGLANIKSFMPNEWGFYYMPGNTWEWCKDSWYVEIRDPESPDKRKADPEYSVIKRGSYSSNSNSRRSSERLKQKKSNSRDNIGFRIAFALRTSSFSQL